MPGCIHAFCCPASQSAGREHSLQFEPVSLPYISKAWLELDKKKKSGVLSAQWEPWVSLGLIRYFLTYPGSRVLKAQLLWPYFTLPLEKTSCLPSSKIHRPKVFTPREPRGPAHPQQPRIWEPPTKIGHKRLPPPVLTLQLQQIRNAQAPQQTPELLQPWPEISTTAASSHLTKEQ